MSGKKAGEIPSVVEQLREAIRQDGRSLNQIGIASGVDASRLSRFMRGERGLTLEAVEKICQELRLVLATYGSPTAAPSPPAAPAGQAEGGRRRKGK